MFECRNKTMDFSKPDGLIPAVIQDDEGLVAIYPYRDADHSKVSGATGNVLLLLCGAPNITLEKLKDSAMLSKRVLTRFCGGAVE